MIERPPGPHSICTWLVGFGIGVPALFIVNEAAQKKLIEADNAAWIVWLFLIGAAIQIFIALLNKVVSWCAYHKHDVGEDKCGRMAKFFASMENMFAIDVISDILSMLAFGWSIGLIVDLFINA